MQGYRNFALESQQYSKPTTPPASPPHPSKGKFAQKKHVLETSIIAQNCTSLQYSYERFSFTKDSDGNPNSFLHCTIIFLRASTSFLTTFVWFFFQNVAVLQVLQIMVLWIHQLADIELHFHGNNQPVWKKNSPKRTMYHDHDDVNQLLNWIYLNQQLRCVKEYPPNKSVISICVCTQSLLIADNMRQKLKHHKFLEFCDVLMFTAFI